MFIIFIFCRKSTKEKEYIETRDKQIPITTMHEVDALDFLIAKVEAISLKLDYINVIIVNPMTMSNIVNIPCEICGYHEHVAFKCPLLHDPLFEQAKYFNEFTQFIPKTHF